MNQSRNSDAAGRLNVRRYTKALLGARYVQRGQLLRANY